MTQELSKVQKAAQKAGSKMANRKTPFIFNEWYVAAFSDEIERKLIKRTILGKQVVFFRKHNGAVVALDNRCVHRSFPLSEGILEDDTIICAYHGLRYDDTGTCIEVPSTGKKPKGVCVRKYPVVEQSPIVWVWMGDPEKADESTIPVIESLGENWRCSKDYMYMEGSYINLHENLLDLTHLSYLHRATFGTPDYASAPFETTVTDEEISVTRSVVPTTLPPVWAEPTGITGENKGARITQTKYVSPCLQLINAKFYNVSVPEAERPDQQILTAHIPTPETQTTTHYFVVHGRNFARENDAITDFMHKQLITAFQEDVVGLALQEEVMAGYDDQEDAYFEISVSTDRPGVAMRQHLKKRSDLEHASEQPVTLSVTR